MMFYQNYKVIIRKFVERQYIPSKVNLTNISRRYLGINKMKIDLTTGTWQDNPGCPINITLVSTSDATQQNKSYRSCQKQETQPKYDIVLSKLFIMILQRALCVHLMREYTLKGKDNTSINIMCLTIIDPAISWFDTI